MFLHTKKTFPIGTEIKVKIDLISKKTLEIAGTVIWIADKKIQLQSFPGMGICFKKIKKSHQDKILEYINKHITHRSSSE